MIIMAGRHERERVRKESNAVTLTSSELVFFSSCRPRRLGIVFSFLFPFSTFWERGPVGMATLFRHNRIAGDAWD